MTDPRDNNADTLDPLDTYMTDQVDGRAGGVVQ